MEVVPLSETSLEAKASSYASLNANVSYGCRQFNFRFGGKEWLFM